MSFESRRLRVQLPCPEGESVKELADVRCPFDTVCNGASFFCDPESCVFGAQSRIGPGGLCHQFGSCDLPTHCDLPTRWGCPTRSVFDPICPGGSLEPFDPGRPVLVEPELLPVLKERLMAQLKEIDKAEEELRKHREANE